MVLQIISDTVNTYWDRMLSLVARPDGVLRLAKPLARRRSRTMHRYVANKVIAVSLTLSLSWGDHRGFVVLRWVRLCSIRHIIPSCER